MYLLETAQSKAYPVAWFSKTLERGFDVGATKFKHIHKSHTTTLKDIVTQTHVHTHNIVWFMSEFHQHCQDIRVNGANMDNSKSISLRLGDDAREAMASTAAAKMGDVFGQLMHEIVEHFETDIEPLAADIVLAPYPSLSYMT